MHVMSGKEVTALLLTGKTKGMPPLTALDPSRWALELTNKFSLPFAVFHERTVAPKRRTSTDSPVGKLAVTLELSSEMETWGVGMVGETGMAEGFLDLSMVLSSNQFAGLVVCRIRMMIRRWRLDEGKRKSRVQN